jgi:hypothetical protein
MSERDDRRRSAHPGQAKADAWEQERERIVDGSTEFQRALNAPWSYEVFANFGWRLTDRGRPSRKLADGNVTFFDVPTGWKVSIYLDARRRPGFSSKVLSGNRGSTIRGMARAAVVSGCSPEVSILWLDQILKEARSFKYFSLRKL